MKTKVYTNTIETQRSMDHLKLTVYEVLKLRYYHHASFGADCTEKVNFKPGSCSFHADLLHPNHFLMICCK